tara:strand:+ start:132427 stop:133866 length:1440 start_codon:yes stop_codon:yes gene_type:complete
MTKNDSSNEQTPVVGISYSWGDPDHKQWVIELAERLYESGVVALLDEWDVSEGHDINHFMERLTTDKNVSKVLVICDSSYAIKADARTGGAGAEASIISAEMYGKSQQERFLPIVRERDSEGNPTLPVYMKGRLYFDFSDDTKFADEFEKLLRNIHKKPRRERPQLGRIPDYLEESALSPKAAHASAETKKSISSQRGNSQGHLADFFEGLQSDVLGLAIDGTDDEDVVESINSSVSLMQAAIDVMSIACRSKKDAELIDPVTNLFESVSNPLLSYDTISRVQNEPSRFFMWEFLIYLSAVCIKYKRYETLNSICSYRFARSTGGSLDWVRYAAFENPLRAVDVDRNKRLETRRISIKADLLKERVGSTAFEFEHLIQADVLLSIRSILTDYKGGHHDSWQPLTVVFVSRFGVELPIFSKLIATGDFSGLVDILGVDNLSSYKTSVENALNDSGAARWRFDYSNIPWKTLLGVGPEGSW